jgi:hypothetical protein
MSWRLVWAVGCALAVPVSANVFAATIWDLLANNAAPPGLSRWGTVAAATISVAAFVVALRWLYRHRHRILDHRALFSSELVEPRPVLITGLSDLRGAQLDVARDLVERVCRDQVPMRDLADLASEVKDKFGDEVARLPWLQNIRAIWSHHARIERVVVLLSTQSQQQFTLFRGLTEALIVSTPELAGRAVALISVGHDVDFFDYNAIQQALAEAFRQARVPRTTHSDETPQPVAWRWRGRQQSLDYSESDITVDVTPGTKQFSIVAAIASFGPEGRFLYVDNLGIPRGYNISLRLAGGLIGD